MSNFVDSYDTDSVMSIDFTQDAQHKKGLHYIFKPEIKRDKLIISVKDTGIGIKKED